MLIILLAWVYITLLCWAWGTLVIQVVKGISGKINPASYEIPITCFLGMSAIAVIAGYLSLIFPLNAVFVHLTIAGPALFQFLLPKRIADFKGAINYQIASLSLPSALIIISGTLLLLVMNSWNVTHPDTVGYHAQIIQWIEKYKAVPGLVHLNSRFGLQNAWFTLCAFFSFKFLNLQHLTFINGAVLVWFIFFVVSRMGSAIKNKQPAVAFFLWLTLLAFSFWSYTQVRLTATSAHPDFIAALYVWLAFYLFYTGHQSPFQLVAVFFLCFTAVTIKLSVAPIILLAVYVIFFLLNQHKKKTVIILTIICVIVLTPFLIRNFITSGYILSPSYIPDITKVDWKYDVEALMQQRKFITAYARIPLTNETQKVNEVLAMPLKKWMPTWWNNLSTADKTILLSLFVVILFSVFYIKRLWRKADKTFWVALTVGVAGLAFWFLNAPDPRFGFGFIIAVTGLLSLFLFKDVPFSYTIPYYKLSAFCMGIFSVVIAAYSFYRFTYYFDNTRIIKPYSLVNTPYASINCNGMPFQIPNKEWPCSNTPIPCTADSCQNFMPRGKEVSDGFKKRVSAVKTY